MEIKGEHLLLFFGAGASVEAGIPISKQMVTDIQQLIENHEDWKMYRELYFYLRSSIHYSDGIFGRFDEPFNVEKLLIVISEIEKRDKNIMYPFIGTWNNRLLDLAGTNFENITKFQKLIRKQLNEWVRIKNYEKASYYQGFDSLQGEIGEMLKVFTLNYDLCFERALKDKRIIEIGFNKETRDWHSSNFDNTSGKHFFLYKLHGSIDWYKKEGDNKLYVSDDSVEKPELIFGIEHKLTSLDPYFYYSSKLRDACINEAKLIVTIGYSFADDYVNTIFSQSLKSKEDLRLLCVTPLFGREKEDEKTTIAKKLSLDKKEQIIIEDAFAQKFMTEMLSKDYLVKHIVEPDDVPFPAL